MSTVSSANSLSISNCINTALILGTTAVVVGGILGAIKEGVNTLQIKTKFFEINLSKNNKS